MCNVTTCFPHVRFSTAEDMEAFARIHCGHFVPVKTGNATIALNDQMESHHFYFVSDAIKPLKAVSAF